MRLGAGFAPKDIPQPFEGFNLVIARGDDFGSFRHPREMGSNAFRWASFGNHILRRSTEIGAILQDAYPMTIALLAAIFGWAALPISILRYQAASFRGVLLLSALASFLFGVHYALIGAAAGAALALSGGLTSLIQAWIGRDLSIRWRIAIALPSVALAFAVREPGLLPVVVFAAFGVSRLAEVFSDEILMRKTMVAAAILWVGYAAGSGSIPVLIAEAIGFGSATWALWRFSRLRPVPPAISSESSTSAS